MPDPDSKCLVINGKSGYVRDNTSWIVGRIFRDFERWMHPAIRTHMNSILDQRFAFEKSQADAISPGSGLYLTRPIQAGLCVAVYRAERPGFPSRDLLYYTGFGVSILQLGIATIPLGVFGDWSIFLITASGIILSIMTCSIPQWRKEKWACRTGTNKKILLTKGNGSQFVILILGGAEGPDLEDLCAGKNWQMTYLGQLQLAVLAALWIVLLITATGIKQHTWFLFAVCAIGIFQNIYVAVTWRTPEAYGVPLTYKEVIGGVKVMDTLFQVEEAYPHVGRNMLDIFFPGNLRPDEAEKWGDFHASARARERVINEQEQRIK